MPRPKGSKNHKTTMALVEPGVAKVIPSITELPWFGKLNHEEQTAVQTEGQQLAQSLYDFGHSKLSIGEHLSKLRDVLEPHNLFGKFLRNFHFSKRTAYRYISGYLNAKNRLPEAILKAAMVRGMAIIGDTEAKPLGIYTDAVRALPPPTMPDEKQAQTWLDQVEDVRKKNRGTEASTEAAPAVMIPQDPDTLLKECYRFVVMRYKRLPNNSRTRSNWVRNLTGMLLSELGVGQAQSISPVAVPPEYRAQRGRPKAVAAA